MERTRTIVQPELGWDDGRWEEEAGRYARLWRNHYGVPENLPDLEPWTEAPPLLWEPEQGETKVTYYLCRGLALFLALILVLRWLRKRL